MEINHKVQTSRNWPWELDHGAWSSGNRHREFDYVDHAMMKFILHLLVQNSLDIVCEEILGANVVVFIIGCIILKIKFTE